MPAIQRKQQKIFAGGLIVSPSGTLAQPGSTAAGAPVYSADLDVLMASARFLQGFAQQCVGNSSPVLQEMNANLLIITQQLAYLLQSGIPEWLTSETYFIGAQCRVGMTTYVSKTDNNQGNAVTDTNNWATLASLVAPSFNLNALPRAWCMFNGQGSVGPGSFYDNFSFTSVVRLGVGNYLLTFPALPHANYGYQLSCNQENASAATVQATRFPPDIKTATQLQVRTVSTFDSSGFDVPEVNVALFCTS